MNLFLCIGPKDSGGYHELITLFQRIDLADVVVVRVDGDRRVLRCDGPAMPVAGLGPDEKNLAYRAAAAYSERCGWPDGFAIELTKHVPVGGGLGGGSADAGAVLRALNALAPRPLDDDALLRLASELGADVAFLTTESAQALATGRGDAMLPAPSGADSLPARNVLVLVPPFAIATADAYRWFDEANPQPSLPVLRLRSRGWDVVEQAAERYGNDFESVLEGRYPDLRACREWLASRGARIARLSGSGSAVFGVFEGPLPEARDLPANVRAIPTSTSARVVQVEARE